MRLVLGLLFATICNAAVVYTLDVSNAEFFGDISLQYTADDYITDDRIVFPSDLDNCTVASGSCSAVEFQIASPYDTDHHPALSLFVQRRFQSNVFRIRNFASTGVYSEVHPFLPDEIGALTVQAVPEPRH
jgi:hypothetical protein